MFDGLWGGSRDAIGLGAEELTTWQMALCMRSLYASREL